jgi:hypothetical protein
MFRHTTSCKRESTGSCRTLHLVDLENLAGMATLTEAAARSTAANYLRAAGHKAGDLLVVAVSHRNGFVAGVAFPGATIRWRSGRNGADLALLDSLQEFDLQRFDRVTVGSGDGVFSMVRTSGLRGPAGFDVVARSGSVSRALCNVARSVALLDEAA